MSQVKVLLSDILGRRVAAAAGWHGVTCFSTCAACSMVSYITGAMPPLAGFNVSGVLYLLVLCGLQLGVLVGHGMVLSASEPPPVHVPSLYLNGRSWPGLIVSRVILRNRKLQDVIKTGGLLAATCLSAVSTLQTYASTQPGATGWTFAFSLKYGVCLGAFYTFQHLMRCREVLAYPSLPRHKLYQLRQRVPACVAPAVQLSITALLLLVAVGVQLPGWQVLWRAVCLASLTTWGWLTAQDFLTVCISEPLRLGHTPLGSREPVRSVLDTLAVNNSIVQDLGLLEVVAAAQGRAAEQQSWRAHVWADETGRSAWVPLAGLLVSELREWVTTLAAALPSAAESKALAEAASSDGVRWNVLGKATSRPGSRQQDVAAWTVRAKRHRVEMCLRALSGLAAASRTEDRYGVVLLTEPVLGDVALLLLSCVLITQQYAKAAASVSSRPATLLLKHVWTLTGPAPHPTQQPVDVCTQALEDVARGCTYQLVQVFGPSLATAVQDARAKPVFGSSVELQTLLKGMLAYRE